MATRALDMMKNLPPVALRKALTCPHCWTEFAPAQIKWVAGDPGLINDVRLGQDKQQRFVPSRFDVAGNAIDVNGGVCHQIACPHCHLTIPRVLLDLSPLFLSILGAPGSGKSYFLSCMIWQLRKILREAFRISFADADPEANLQLTQYEETLFLNPDPMLPAALRKTETQGDLYQSVSYGDHDIWYPRPFVFTAQPETDHVYAKNKRKLSRAICLYDNAGEHFLPGNQSTTNRATHHLQHSEALLFLFDPTQHPKFRSACAGSSNDPQIQENLWSHPQHQILAEAGKRIKESRGLPSTKKLQTPLIVIATKHDAWKSLTGDSLLSSSKVMQSIRGGGHCLLLDAIQQHSKKLRSVLWEHSHEIVSAAEALSEQVFFLPVSLFRRPPMKSPDDGKLMIRPSDISPTGVDLPILLALALAVPGLVPTVDRQS